MPAYAVVIISLGSGILVALLIQFAVAPWLKKRILAQEEVDIQRASVAAEDDRNLPELQLPDETPGTVFYQFLETVFFEINCEIDSPQILELTNWGVPYLKHFECGLKPGFLKS